jgi:hypothetical protein
MSLRCIFNFFNKIEILEGVFQLLVVNNMLQSSSNFQSFMQVSISTVSDNKRRRRSSIILPIKLKHDFEEIVETETDIISLAIIDRIRKVSLWSGHQRSKSKSSSYAVTLSLSR